MSNPLEFIHGGLEGGLLQSGIEEIRKSLQSGSDDNADAAATAATSVGTAYTPADETVWDDPDPTTVAEALDRLAYHISNGDGAVPIVVLP